jgi:hypothetical protein
MDYSENFFEGYWEPPGLPPPPEERGGIPVVFKKFQPVKMIFPRI